MGEFESVGIDDAYTDRNLLAMTLAAIARRGEYQVGIKNNDDDPDYPLLFVDLPTGQISYHVSLSDLNRAEFIWPTYAGEWDGHTLEEKRARVEDFMWDMMMIRTWVLEL